MIERYDMFHIEISVTSLACNACLIGLDERQNDMLRGFCELLLQQARSDDLEVFRISMAFVQSYKAHNPACIIRDGPVPITKLRTLMNG